MRPELETQVEQGLMGAASELAHRLNLPTTLIKFAMVGGIAFAIYQVFLYLIYGEPPVSFFPDLSGLLWFLPDRHTRTDLFLFEHPDIRLLIASVIAIELAIVFQFNSHERWTFRRRPREGWIVPRFIKFNISSIVSPIIIVITTNVLALTLDVSPYLASIAGVLIGFAWNWTMTSLVIWPKERAAPWVIEAEDPDFRPA